MNDTVLEVKNLTYKIPLKAKDKINANFNYRLRHKKFIADKNNNYKTILENVNLHVNAGELVAIIGASGSGKTSLLNIIANRIYTRTYEGDVLILNKKVGPWIKQQIGYVMQEDVLYALDTPRESLQFVADMKLHKKDSKTLVQNVIEQVGLSKAADTRVGSAAGGGFDAGFGKVGISGGERKRVSIGREIVSGAKLLLLDECTSGLDIHTANQIIQLLRKLSNGEENEASENMTVVCTLHQPSSLMWGLFDRIVLMNRGRVVYNARTEHFVRHIELLKETVPQMYNPADFLIEYVTGEKAEENVQKLIQITKQQQFEDMQQKCGLNNCSLLLNQTTNKKLYMQNQEMAQQPQTCYVVKQKQVIDLAETINVNPNSAPVLEDYKKADFVQEAVFDNNKSKTRRKYDQMRMENQNNIFTYLFKSIYELFNPKAKYARNYFYQYFILLKRQFTHFIKAPNLLIRFLMQYTITGLFCGSLYFRVKHNFTNTNTLIGALFYVQMMVSFPVAGEISVRMFQARQGYFREHAGGTYGTAPYLLAHLTADFPIYLVFVLYLSTITWWMVGFNASFARFVYFCVILLFTLYSVLSMSLCFAFMFKSFVSANVAQMIVMSIFIIFSGPYINNKIIPVYWSWMPWVSVFAYAFRALMYIVFDGAVVNCDLQQECPDVFQYYGMDGFSLTSSMFIAIGYMVGWILGFMLITYMLLKYRRFS